MCLRIKFCNHQRPVSFTFEPPLCTPLFCIRMSTDFDYSCSVCIALCVVEKINYLSFFLSFKLKIMKICLTSTRRLSVVNVLMFQRTCSLTVISLASPNPSPMKYNIMFFVRNSLFCTNIRKSRRQRN